MDNNNESTPATSGTKTSTVPAGAGWGPMGGEYYNMYPWQQMMPQGGGQGVPGMQPGMQMMPGWRAEMQMMSRWQAGVQPVMQGTPGEGGQCLSPHY